MFSMNVYNESKKSAEKLSKMSKEKLNRMYEENGKFSMISENTENKTDISKQL